MTQAANAARYETLLALIERVETDAGECYVLNLPTRDLYLDDLLDEIMAEEERRAESETDDYFGPWWQRPVTREIAQ